MTTFHIIGALALCAPILQIVVMGVFGYPVARRRVGGMERFRNSGFLWWLGVLCGISLLGVMLIPGSLTAAYPAQHEFSLARVMGGAALALVFCVAVELFGERALYGRSGSDLRTRATHRYEGVLPRWARSGISQLLLVVALAVVQEFVFRSLALGALWHEWGIPKFYAAGLVAVAYGFAHWHYGFRRITLKLLVGSALVWAALTGGWLAAALAHVALNLIMTLMSWGKALPTLGSSRPGLSRLEAA